MSNSCVHHRCMLFVHTLNPIQARHIQTRKNRAAKSFYRQKHIVLLTYCYLIFKTSYPVTRIYSRSIFWKEKGTEDKSVTSHQWDEMFASIRRRQFYSDWSTSKWFQNPVRRNFSSNTRKTSAFPSHQLALFIAFIGRHFQVESTVDAQSIFEHTSQLNDATPSKRLRTGRQTHVCTWNVTRHNYCGSPECGRTL